MQIIFRIVVQIIFSFMLFVTSGFISLYEGSSIKEDPWEWSYSTPFSMLFNGEVEKASDIIVLDYFIYAIKFQPTFPLVMLICIFYLLILIGIALLKKNKLWSLYFRMVSCLLLGCAIALFNASTTGGKAFFVTFILASIVFMIISFALRNKLYEASVENEKNIMTKY